MTFSSCADDGAKMVIPGMFRQSAMSRMPWWLGPSSPVIPARSRAKTTGRPWRPDVQVGLVEGPAEKRRVNGHHWPQPSHGHAGGRGHGRLLGDPDIEKAIGPALLER